MAVAFTEPASSRADELLNALRLRIADTVGDLKPPDGLFDFDTMRDRLSAVAEELHDIERQLRMVVHIAKIDCGDMEERIAEIEARLADGWTPSGRPAEEVIAELRKRA